MLASCQVTSSSPLNSRSRLLVISTMAATGSYNNDRPPSVDADYSADPASGSFFSTEYKKCVQQHCPYSFLSRPAGTGLEAPCPLPVALLYMWHPLSLPLALSISLTPPYHCLCLFTRRPTPPHWLKYS